VPIGCSLTDKWVSHIGDLSNNRALLIIIDLIIIIIIIIIPVIIGATGIVSKSLQKYLETIPGQHSIDSLQINCHTRNMTHHKESATS
jgi:ABC-type sulfate transport system permease subunit